MGLQVLEIKNFQTRKVLAKSLATFRDLNPVPHSIPWNIYFRFAQIYIWVCRDLNPGHLH